MSSSNVKRMPNMISYNSTDNEAWNEPTRNGKENASCQPNRKNPLHHQ